MRFFLLSCILACYDAEALLFTSPSPHLGRVVTRPGADLATSNPLFSVRTEHSDDMPETVEDKVVATFLWSTGLPHAKLVDKVFLESDTNEDGKIDFAETYELILQLYLRLNRRAPIPPPGKQSIRLIFDDCDVDQSGFIERKEFGRLVRILMRRAFWRMASHQSVTLLGAPLLTEYLIRVFRHKRWLFKTVKKHAPASVKSLVTSPTFWRTMMLLFLVNCLGNLVLGLVNKLIDYSRNVESEETDT